MKIYGIHTESAICSEAFCGASPDRLDSLPKV